VVGFNLRLDHVWSLHQVMGTCVEHHPVAMGQSHRHCGLTFTFLPCSCNSDLSYWKLNARLALPITPWTKRFAIWRKIIKALRQIGEILFWWLLVMLSAVYDSIIHCSPLFKLRKWPHIQPTQIPSQCLAGWTIAR